MLRKLSLLNTQPELIECTSVIRLRMRLRDEQKTLSPVYRGEGHCSRNVFYSSPSPSASPAGAALLKSLGGRTVFSPG